VHRLFSVRSSVTDVVLAYAYARAVVRTFDFSRTATTDISPLSLHDALPISSAPDPARTSASHARPQAGDSDRPLRAAGRRFADADRKSTRLNSSHQIISYAVFCLKKKNHGAERPRLVNRPRIRASGLPTAGT